MQYVASVPDSPRVQMKNRKERGEPGKTYHMRMLERIYWASLSEPHTSVTALLMRVCIYACTLGLTTYRKF